MTDYTPSGKPEDNTRGISKQVRDEFTLVQTAINSKVNSNLFVLTGTEAQGATANDYVITSSPALSSYVNGTIVSFKATHTNTGAATIKYSGAASNIPLKNTYGSDLQSGEIVNNSVVFAYYYNSVFYLITGPFNYSSRALPFVSVKEFNAKGDGVTNDTSAIQAACDYVGTLGGGVIHFPVGTYVTTNAITISSGTIISGMGPKSIIKSNILEYAVSYGHRQFHCVGVSKLSFRDIALDSSGMSAWSGGMRSILFQNCTDYHVERVNFTTNGAATASIGCSKFWIINNEVTISATDSTAHHDGIIDQWGGCSKFKVLNNRINGNSIGIYGILVTGEDTAGLPTANYLFDVSGNDILSVTEVGLWLNGREGTNYNFHVDRNTIDGVTNYYGLAIADCREGVVSSNISKSTGRAGIRLYQETSQGGSLGAVNIVVSDNVVMNANVLADANVSDGSAISVIDNSSGCIISKNRVVGSNHRYGVYFGASTVNCREFGNIVDQGVSGSKSSASNTSLLESGTYTPTLTGVANVASSIAYQSNYMVRDGVVTVALKVTISPTAAASTATQLGISLPIPSNLANLDTDLQGSANSSFGLVAAIYADTVNDRAQLQFPASNTSANVLYGQFSYRLL